VLSSESNKSETTWSVGRYATGAEIWQAFSLKGDPPTPKGVYSNQPNPHAGKPAASWKLFGLFFALALAILIYFASTQRSQPLFTAYNTFDPSLQTDQSYVSKPFEISGGHTTAVHIKADATPLNQNWIYLAIALVNVDSNESYDLGVTLSHYSGVDGGESWSEGSADQESSVHSVPPGRYYVRIDPEREREAGETVQAAMRPIHYTVEAHQGGANFGLFFIVILLLLPPPIIAWWRYRSFEQQRWSESDMSGGTE
jgi:hypothetical protein